MAHGNGFERCRDWPLHGSRFGPDGEVLQGPAVSPLAAVEDGRTAPAEPRPSANDLRPRA